MPLLIYQTDPLLEVVLDSLYQALLVLFSYILHLYLQATIQWLLLHLPIILLVTAGLLGPLQHQQPPLPQVQPFQPGPNILPPPTQQLGLARCQRQA